jgi:hypothetical protein
VHSIAILENLCCVTVDERQFFTRFRVENDLSALQFEDADDKNSKSDTDIRVEAYCMKFMLSIPLQVGYIICWSITI